MSRIRTHTLTIPQINEARAMRDSGRSYASIAAHFGMSTSTIWHQINFGSPEELAAQRQLTAIAALDYVAQGHTVLEAAHHLGINPSTMLHRIKKYRESIA